MVVCGARDVRPSRQTGRLRFVLNTYPNEVENKKKKHTHTHTRRIKRRMITTVGIRNETVKNERNA